MCGGGGHGGQRSPFAERDIAYWGLTAASLRGRMRKPRSKEAWGLADSQFIAETDHQFSFRERCVMLRGVGCPVLSGWQRARKGDCSLLNDTSGRISALILPREIPLVLQRLLIKTRKIMLTWKLLKHCSTVYCAILQGGLLCMGTLSHSTKLLRREVLELQLRVQDTARIPKSLDFRSPCLHNVKESISL